MLWARVPSKVGTRVPDRMPVTAPTFPHHDLLWWDNIYSPAKKRMQYEHCQQCHRPSSERYLASAHIRPGTAHRIEFKSGLRRLRQRAGQLFHAGANLLRWLIAWMPNLEASSPGFIPLLSRFSLSSPIVLIIPAFEREALMVFIDERSDTITEVWG